ncbi:hypothetical protein [Nostoc sp. DedQUE07]|uniref:hypothetical protein n=1 Tax=Nostoc sp. DedQUE07 TaxID=3075392 RepID=UPI002AD2EC54|nr:hypothetical protein [Nostoc sp. DedQUE07]MDZ8131869.1 hypothetical protein [Nostoc sp. DedQUE07]
MNNEPLTYLPNSLFESAADYLVSSANEPPILIFLDGQYVFRWVESGRVQTKLISSASVRAAFSNEPIDSGWLNNNIIRCGVCAKGDWCVRFSPPGKLDLLLYFKESGVEKISVPMPGLVFFGIAEKYYIWAIKEDEFSPKSIAYHAPLPNVSTDKNQYDGDIAGRICFGQNFLPSANPAGIEKAWQIFFAAAFTDHLVDGKSTKNRSDIRTSLLLLKGKKKYPKGTLIPVFGNYSIDTIITRATRNYQ